MTAVFAHFSNNRRHECANYGQIQYESAGPWREKSKWDRHIPDAINQDSRDQCINTTRRDSKLHHRMHVRRATQYISICRRHSTRTRGDIIAYAVISHTPAAHARAVKLSACSDRRYAAICMGKSIVLNVTQGPKRESAQAL